MKYFAEISCIYIIYENIIRLSLNRIQENRIQPKLLQFAFTKIVQL